MSDVSSWTGGSPPRSFGAPRKDLDETGSTNDDALRWAEDGAPEGALVVAEQQTAGRGRRGRTWLSEPGHSLLFSVVLRPPARALPLVSTAVGVGVCEGVRAATRLSVLVKWPNDLVVGDRKLAGILVESRSSAGDIVAVAGVGLNLSWPEDRPPPDIEDIATSLRQESERSGLDEIPSRAVVLERVVAGIERRYRQLVGGGGADVVTTAESLSSLVGRDVVLRLPTGEEERGMVTGLSVEGGLELSTASGQVTFTSAEIETVRRG